jgi:hypothetical protein
MHTTITPARWGKKKKQKQKEEDEADPRHDISQPLTLNSRTKDKPASFYGGKDICPSPPDKPQTGSPEQTACQLATRTQQLQN